jgi:hypothetical protein
MIIQAVGLAPITPSADAAALPTPVAPARPTALLLWQDKYASGDSADGCLEELPLALLRRLPGHQTRLECMARPATCRG